MRKYLIMLVTCSSFISSTSSFSAKASGDDSYKFVSFGLSYVNEVTDLTNLNLSQIEVDLVPEISFGLGKHYRLNEDWQIASEVSFRYAKAHFSGLVENTHVSKLPQGQKNYSGNYQTLGLWATSRFKYVSLSESVSPFIEVAVGAVQTNHATLFGEEKNNAIAFKAVTGLEFEVANDMTFSIGVGFSDNDDNF